MLRFDVPDMTCGGCARGVTRAVQSVDPSAKVQADPPGRMVQVETSSDPAALMAALVEARFPASLLRGTRT